jgi:hypothetical protein
LTDVSSDLVRTTPSITCIRQTRLRLLRGFRFVIAILTCLGVAPALAEVKLLTHDTRFCPSWAEAHERTIASLNNGRPAYPVKWKGCIMLKRGTPVDVVDQQEESTEIVVLGKHWFTDE